MQENNKIEDEYYLMPCPCPCHRNTGMMHFMACCENGFIKVRKPPTAPSSTPQSSVEGIRESMMLNCGNTHQEKLEWLVNKCSQLQSQLLSANKEVEELRNELGSWKKTAEQAQDLWQEKDKQLEYWKARCEAAEKFMRWLRIPSAETWSKEEESAYYNWNELKQGQP